MEKNQILAALQIENDEVRLVVGEFYNDVLYIIAKQTVPCKGVSGVRIMDETKVIDSIREAANEISEKLKTPLQSVLLCIPGYRFKREKRLFDRLLDEKKITADVIKDIFQQAYQVNVGSDYGIINIACANYKANGITYPKMPLNENSEMLSAEVDLICGDRQTMYDYVSIVEKAGLQVLDIYQDGFASSAEAALYEQSFNNFVVNIHLEGAHTVLSLIYNGRLVAGLSDNIGYDQLIKPIMVKYSLSYKDAAKLLFRYGIIGQQEGEERVINRWKDANGEQTATYRQIQECIYPAGCELVDNFYSYCCNIISQEKVTILISGHGASLQNLQETLTEKFGKPVKCYCPDTLGVREAKWSALLGMFYLYKDNSVLSSKVSNSVDMNSFKQNLVVKPTEEEDKNITSKLKNLTDKLFVEKE